MSLNAGNVLKINITLDSKDKILEYVRKYLNNDVEINDLRAKKHKKPLIIVTPNSEQLVSAQQDTHFAKILNWADIAIPDGIGVVFAMRYFGKKMNFSASSSSIHRIAGVDFMKDLVALASEERVTIGLMGGQRGLAVKTYECLHSEHSKLKGWGEDGPDITIERNDLKFVNFDEKGQVEYFKSLAKRIGDTHTQLIFVGLGAPKQEYFIERLASHLVTLNFPIVLMSVGGSFDLISGNVKRAPHLFRLIGFEWAWRLVQEPWRWKRQLSLPRFVWLLLKSKLSG